MLSIPTKRTVVVVVTHNAPIARETTASRNKHLTVEAQERALEIQIYEVELEAQMEEEIRLQMEYPPQNGNITLSMVSSQQRIIYLKV